MEAAFYLKINGGNILKKFFILNIIIIMFMGIVLPKSILAAQKRYPYTDGILKDYAGYDELIQALKKKHPNWTFTILDTGLNWNDVIKQETVAVHGRNLIYYTNGGSWVCSTCGDRLYDSGRWKCASETAVTYYMDPRNWINDTNIFQFENLAYNGDVQNVAGVKKILASVPWANTEKISYVTTDGTSALLEKSYAEVIMEAAKEAGISPYHLAARIKQEQGAGSSASSTGAGRYMGYVGYYNFLNIKATGSNIIANALAHAKASGWDNPEKSIKGGAKFLASEYITRGQSTLYLQKFDVDNSDGALYYHQYMQNVSAAVTEGQTVRSSYASMDLIDASLNFVIPVYNNMPATISPSPDGIKFVTENVKVTGDKVAVRTGKSTEFNSIATLNKGAKILRIETSLLKDNGNYWDKVVLDDGKIGYVARDFLEKINDISTMQVQYVVNSPVNLRNGPGCTGTSIITTLGIGQVLTVMDDTKYKGLDGYNWSRVKLSSGQQGYVASNFLSDLKSTNYPMATINCDEGSKVYVRSGIGTNTSSVTLLGRGTEVTVIQKAAGEANGYKWDKIIVNSNGLTGYVANAFLKYKEEPKPANTGNTTNTANNTTNTSNNTTNATNTTGNNTTNTTNTTGNTTNTSPSTTVNHDIFKVEGENIIAIPELTVANIKAIYPKAVVKLGNTVMADNDIVGTGNIATIDNKNYTIIKKGDVNGDGVVKATDYMKIKNYIMGISQLTEAQMNAADVNNDGNVKATDYMKIKNYIMGTSKIEL